MLFKFLLVFILFAASATADFLLEIKFDLAVNQEVEDGYTSGDSLNSMAASRYLQWMRYFNVIVSGDANKVTMRIAHFSFKDPQDWAEFQQENQLRIQILFDHFWTYSERFLWHVVDSDNSWPQNERQEGGTAGFVLQIQYSPMLGREQMIKQELAREHYPKLIEQLEGNSGFLERKVFESDFFQSKAMRMETFEFADVPSLMEIRSGKVFGNLVSRISSMSKSWSMTVLSPGADEAMYWLPGPTQSDETEQQEADVPQYE